LSFVLERQLHIRNRAAAINKATVNHYFDLLEVTFPKSGPLDRPSLIFNADESGMLLSPCPCNWVGIKEMKWVQCMTSGVKTQVTVLCCVVQQGVPFLPRSFSAQELTEKFDGGGNAWYNVWA